VAGEICRDPARRVGDETVTLDEEAVVSPEEERDWLLHKPVGLACSHDVRESPLVFDLLPERLRRRGLRIAGRLDRDTSGLLVLSDDGDLVHRLTHPARKLPKRYRVAFEGELVEDAVARCAEGLLLPGDARPTRPAELRLEGPGRATLVLREGRTHQVRRMVRVLGGRVVALHRDRIGGLDLPGDLAPGEGRPLAPDDRRRLLSDSSL
jgi:16S rRNA pseudouridine516 synthase